MDNGAYGIRPDNARVAKWHFHWISQAIGIPDLYNEIYEFIASAKDIV